MKTQITNSRFGKWAARTAGATLITSVALHAGIASAAASTSQESHTQHVATGATVQSKTPRKSAEYAGMYWEVWTDNYSYTYYYTLCWQQGGYPLILQQYGGTGLFAQYTLLGCSAY